MSVELGPVLDELTQRQRSRSDINVATMTVVVFFDDPVVGAWARDRTHMLAVKHPSRVIIFDATLPATAYEIGAACESHAGSLKMRGEWIELGALESTPESLLSAIGALALPDAPTVLIWVACGIGLDPRFAAIAAPMRTVVYNSSVIDEDDGALRQLVAFMQTQGGLPIADLSYLRLAPWQDSVALLFDGRDVTAELFDGRDVTAELFDLRRVEITSGSDAEAYYLLGWLASRLEWSLHSADSFTNRFGTQIEFAIRRGGPPRRIRRVELHSSQTQFVANVDERNAEAIVLTVRGAKARRDRCRAINDTDTPSLVERAILTGQGDRVFFESLVAAGDILARRAEASNE